MNKKWKTAALPNTVGSYPILKFKDLLVKYSLANSLTTLQLVYKNLKFKYEYEVPTYVYLCTYRIYFMLSK